MYIFSIKGRYNVVKKELKFLMLLFMFLFFIVPNDAFAATNQLSYKGTLPNYQIHTYKFKTSKQNIVNVNLTGNVLYQLVSLADETDYQSGDILPVGEYELSVSPIEYSSQTYSIIIDGDLGLTGDTNLPLLNITSPSNGYTRLNAGTFSVAYKGSTNGISANYTLNHNLPVKLGPTWSNNLNVLFGRNTINTYTESTSKNSVLDTRKVVSPGVLRISGSDRYVTSVNVSKEIEKEGYDINTVIITNNVIDGIPGIVLANNELAPILLTRTESLPTAVKNEITRLGATKAIILGGEVSVSANVETELSQMGLSVERISGTDRYISSTKIAEKVVDEYTDTAIIVNGDGYPDGLLASTYAAINQKPILYTRPDSLPAAIKNFLTSHPNITNYIIVGGSVAVSNTVESELSSLGGSVSRIYGDNRYDTSLQVFYGLGIQSAGEGEGEGYGFTLISNELDGITAGLLASIKKSNILITDPTTLPRVTEGVLSGFSSEKLIENVYIIGGTNAISTSIEDDLRSKIK